MNTLALPGDLSGSRHRVLSGRGSHARDRPLRLHLGHIRRKPGAVYAGNNGDVAADHYHRYEEDLDLMAELGVTAYRFSIAWPRVIPGGTGEVNRAGVDFYHRLLDAMRERGISAFATLYHWDLPQVLEDSGGWANRQTALAFAKYAEVCFREFGGKVEKWFTLNEPWCSAYLGYMTGTHAPGRKSTRETVDAIHHLNLAHGLAVRAFRDSGMPGEIGIVWNLSRPRPASAKPEDILAAEAATDRDSRMFTGPVLGKGYPKTALASLASSLPSRLAIWKRSPPRSISPASTTISSTSWRGIPILPGGSSRCHGGSLARRWAGLWFPAAFCASCAGFPRKPRDSLCM